MERDKASRHRAIMRILNSNLPMTTTRLRELLQSDGVIVSDRTWRRDLTELELDGSMLVCGAETVST